jgi:hypothetical protein
MTHRTPALRFFVLVPMLLVFALPSRAELVILTDGNIMKVKAYALDGEQANLSLPAGGHMTLPISRVERVVDDEVAEPEPPVREPMGPPLPPTRIVLRFEGSQKIPAGPWGGLIWEAAKRNSLNPRLIEAVLRAESDGNPRAISRVGARGLMQLMPATAERFGVPNYALYDPAWNLEAGSRYLSWLVDQFPGDLTKILAAYNAGEGAVVRYGGLPPYRETRAYVHRILATLGLDVAVPEPLQSGTPTAVATVASRTASSSR